MNIHVFAVYNVALSHWKPIVKLSSVCLSGEDKECPVYHHLAQEQHVWVGWPTGGDLQDGQLYEVGDRQPQQLGPTSTGSQCQQLRHSQITDQLIYRNTCSNINMFESPTCSSVAKEHLFKSPVLSVLLGVVYKPVGEDTWSGDGYM